MGKPKIGPGRRTLAALVMVLLLAGLLPPAGITRAANLSIPCANGIGDTAALIKAITTASRNRQSDVITLGGSPEEPCTYTLTAPNNTTGGANGLPVIGPDSGRILTIVGNGATIRRSPGAKPFRLLAVDGGNLTLRDLTLEGGIAVGDSGAGRNGGRSGGFGGAISNAGTLVLSGVTVSGSEARGGDGAGRTARDSGGGGGGGAGLGGAIFNAAGASLTITSSTLSGNTARGGSGGAGGANGPGFLGGGGGGNGGDGGTAPSRTGQPGRSGSPGAGLGGGGGGGGGSSGSASSSFAPGSPAAGPGGAGAFGGGGGGAGASRFGGSGGAGGLAGAEGGVGGTSCCSHAGGGGGGAGLGGAIFNYGGAVAITSSTLYGNLALGGAGGPGSFGFGDGEPGAGRGGAVYSLGGSVSYGGSILAGNGAADCAASTPSALSTLGFNLLAPAGGCAAGAGDLQPAGDLGVLPLAANGGPTSTHALAPDSPAVDAGGPTCPAADQRGVARPQGPACDIGAFELVPQVLELVVTTTADAGPGSLRAALVAANSRPGPDTIRFAIEGSPIITLASPLPAQSGPVSVDGLTQPGATEQAPTVTLDGSGLTGEPDGLTLAGGASFVRGLVITGFGGAAISVPAGAGNTLRGNRLVGNGLAIDLGDDGPTPNDPGDADAGPNALLNTPLLTPSETATGTLVKGLLDAPAGEYTVDLYAATTCAVTDNGEGAQPRLSGPGESAEPLASFTVAAGQSFAHAVEGRADQWFTAVATDASGNTSELAPCAPVSTNDLWTNATDLVLSGGQTTVSQGINRPYQERWYRFPVGPGGRVRVRLVGQPGSVLTLHRDLEQVYRQLTLPQSAEAIAVNEQTTGFLPGAYLPGAYLPGAYLPGAYLPGAYLPGAYLPGAYLPGAYLPGAYLPGAYLPGAYLPGAYLPGAYLPGAYLPGAYLAAARAGLMAFAADPAADELTVERNTWDLAEDLYVRVVGPAGSTFQLTVSFEGGICLNLAPIPSGLDVVAEDAPITAGEADLFDSLILWRSSAHPDLAPDLPGFLADNPGVDGLLVDLDQAAPSGPRFPRVAAARALLAADPSCVSRANAVAGEIKAVVDAYRAANSAGGTTSLSAIVLIGGDEDIPFFRYPDVAGLASESEFYPPVEDISASNAALREGRVLGQDAYGSTLFIRRGVYDLPVPDLAVGRLVGNSTTVRGLLAAFSADGGQVSPDTALVTGYDFVADGALAVYDDLSAALAPNGAPDRLVQDASLPDDAGAWSADDLRARLLDPAIRNDLVFFTGHFAPGSALAADYQSSLLASEIAASGADFTNTILFGLGCHSGYNVPTPDAIPGFSPEPDWPEAWAQAGATYIAATGFAYGDTELVEYGERLLQNIARSMSAGPGPVPIGQALVRAKQGYLAQKASLSGIDEKTLLQFTLYGLPMLAVDLPGEVPGAADGQLVDTLLPVGGNPYGLKRGASGGSDVVSVTSNPQLRTVTLDDAGSPVTARYYEGQGGAVVANPTEPIFPLERREVDLSDPAEGRQILRGIGFRGGSFEEQAGLALTSAPTTESARGYLKFLSDTFYPSQPWSANFLDAVHGGPARLFAVPAQYRAGLDGGVFRVYSRMDFRLYYLDADWPASIQSAGLAAAPDIVQVESLRLAGGAVEFRVNVVDAAGIGVEEVWVTYSVPGSGTWQSVDLSPGPGDPTLWVGPAGGLSLPDGTEFMVQAAGAAGKIGLDTNAGAYYLVAPTEPTVPPATAATSLVAESLPEGGVYGERVTFAARLLGPRGLPLAGRSVRLLLGAQVALAETDEGGLATFALDLAQLPAAYDLLMVYGGEPGFAAARLKASFTIAPAPTSLRLDPGEPTTVVAGEDTGLVATLTTAGEVGAPIADATVLFVAEGEGGSFGAAAKTGIDGRAVLGAVPWPLGAYTVTARYRGNGAAEGAPASAVPYLPSQSPGVGLTIGDEPEVEPDQALCYAPGAQSVVAYSPGKRKDGKPVDPARRNPELALGLPQKNDTINFVTLGFSGTLTLAFRNPIVNDGTAAPDIRVWDTSFGDATRPWSSYPEAVQIFASEDGESWSFVGQTSDKDEAYDLGLARASFLRFVDVSDPARFGSTDDGFDLDAVEVLGGCVPGPGGEPTE